MILSDTVFLAAYTARSQAYAQALANAGIAPGKTLLFGSGTGRRLGQADGGLKRVMIPGIFTPDLSEPLEQTCAQFGTPVIEVDAGNISSPVIEAHLVLHAPNLVIFSGYGGEFVPAKLCSNWRILHQHAGWLPDYRGSTTGYYSLLAEGRCGVSAILLSPEIDAGRILAREHYPPPSANVDIDYVYDGAIRADLLINVLRSYSKSGGDLSGIDQDLEEGQIFYVIHPLLKNIVIDRIRSGQPLVRK